MNALIIDDEKSVVRSIRSTIDWSTYQIDKVMTAYRIEEAKAILLNGNIDILIYDMDMPDTDCIESLTWIRKNELTCEIILLTDKFNDIYFRDVLRLGAIDYLIKPIDYKELEKDLNRIAAKRNDQKIEDEKKAYGCFWIENQILVKELFWKNLCLERIPNDPIKIEKKAQSSNVEMDKDIHFKLVLTTIANIDKIFGIWGEDCCQTAIQNLAKVILKNNQIDCKVIIIYTHVVIILNENEFDGFKEKCWPFIQKCREMLGADVVCYISESIYCEDIAETYRRLLNYSRDDLLHQNNIVEVSKDSDTASDEEVIVPSDWDGLLYGGAVDSLLEKVRCFLTDLAEKNKLHEKNFRIFQQDVLQMFFNYMDKNELKARNLYENHDIYQLYKSATLSIDDMCQWIKKCLEFIVQKTDTDNSVPQNEKIVRLIKRYIKQNLKNDIPRDQIENAINLNADYIARIFKRVTGYTIHEYLVEKRIEHAKTLLKTTNLSVSEIAVESGYDNFSYFIKLFKKNAGTTPKAYRRRIL